LRSVVRFSSWPAQRKILLLRAFGIVAFVRIVLWILPYRRWHEWLKLSEPIQEHTRDWARIREVTAAVKRASQFMPQATCLTQAIATRRLLRGAGQTCQLRIGVDKDGMQKLIAHAWIEVDGKIVIGKLKDIRPIV